MPLIRPGIRRLFSFRTRPETLSTEVDEEIALHLELRVKQLKASGLSEDEAREEATRRFGAHEVARNRLRAAAKTRERRMNVRDHFESLTQDALYAARGLMREHWFTVFVAVTLGLGIGVNAAMFGIVDRLLLRGPDHVREPEGLYNLHMTSQKPGMDPSTGNFFGYVTYSLLRDNASRMRVAVFKRSPEGMRYGRGENAQLWNSAEATHDLFPLLGTTPLLGRFFSADEVGESPSQRVAVLGYRVWKRVFNSDSGIVGKSVTLRDRDYTVIGVARKGFTGPELGPVDVWLPAALTSGNTVSDWSWRGIHVVARLDSLSSSTQAASQATTLYRNAYGGREAHMKSATLTLAPISFTSEGKESPETRISRWLMGVCIVVLLVACSNVANLLLARAVRRRREVAVRLALGVSRWRLLRLFVVESLMLSSVGAIVSVGVAVIAGTFIRRVLLPDIEWSSSVLDSRVLGVSLLIALLVGLAVGLLPAWRASRPDLSVALKSGARDGGGRQSRLRAVLTVAQAALSVVLLVGAGLFVRSLSNVHSIDLGIEPEHVMVTGLSWRSMPSGVTDDARQAESSRRSEVYLQVLERVQKLPQVEFASMTVGLPFQSYMSLRLRVPGWDSLPKIKSGDPSFSYITNDYFKTTGARILAGRAFSADDRAGSESVTIVSQTMAKVLWPGKDPVGTCIYFKSDSVPPCTRIVGVVTDAHRFALEEEPSMHWYVPLSQSGGASGTDLLVRPKGDMNEAIVAVRKAALDVDPTISYVRSNSLQETVAPQMRPWQLGANVFALMGVLALCVASIGLYSVMSYLVAQRRHELGIRLALGAESGDMLRLIMKSGIGTATVGVLIGVVVALLCGRFIEPLLFHTSSRDALVFFTVTLTLLIVSALASVIPALRARRINPIEALRSE